MNPPPAFDGATPKKAQQLSCSARAHSTLAGLCSEAGAHGHDHGHGAHGHHDHGHKSDAGATGGTYNTVPAGWSGPVYTCPMHPQVRQTEPGSCPICGMDLELDSAAMARFGLDPTLCPTIDTDPKSGSFLSPIPVAVGAGRTPAWSSWS